MSVRLLPIIILVILTSMGLGFVISKHGKPKKEKYDAWSHLIALIIEWGLILWAIL